MQSHTLTVRAINRSSDDSNSIHQFRNLAEDISRALCDKRFAKVSSDIDLVTDRLVIEVHSSGKLRAAERLVQECLNESGMWKTCELVIDPGQT